MIQQQRPSGWAELSAFVRQGAKELAQILPAFPSSGVQPVEEIGTLGNPTMQQVYDTTYSQSPRSFSMDPAPSPMPPQGQNPVSQALDAGRQAAQGQQDRSQTQAAEAQQNGQQSQQSPQAQQGDQQQDRAQNPVSEALQAGQQASPQQPQAQQQMSYGR